MRKFTAIFKEQKTAADNLNEQKVVDSFKLVYDALLEKYEVSGYKDLSEEYQDVFLNELHSYWDDQNGLSKKGEKFLNSKSQYLSEHATTLQKKNFFKAKVNPIISESIRQADLKTKVYDVIDEMYSSVNGSNVSDVLAPKVMVEMIKEAFISAGKEVISEMHYELFESAKVEKKSELNERKFSKEEREKLAKKGYALPDGSFPIENVSDLKNAIKAYGRGDNPQKEKAHIIKRAKALGKSDLIPDKWKKKLNEALSGHQQKSLEFIKPLLKELNIKAKGIPKDGMIYITTADRNRKVLAQLTPKGWIYVAGFGDFAPENFDDERGKIKIGIESVRDSVD